MPVTPPKKLLTKKVLITFFVLVIIGLLELALIAFKLENSNSSNNSSVNNPPPYHGSSAAENFNKRSYTTNEAKSPWVVVNKGRILPSTYVPANLVVPKVSINYAKTTDDSHLRSDAAKALESMFAAAKLKGFDLKLFSGYRSYTEQVSVYNGFVKSSGQAEADTFSARPGHSEHQTGLAADISTLSRTCELDQCFGDTPEGKWLVDNAYKFGFIVRYQKSQEKLTGYEYEPWHLRYVGAGLAAEIHRTGETLEQYFGLPIYDDYPADSYKLKYAIYPD